MNEIDFTEPEFPLPEVGQCVFAGMDGERGPVLMLTEHWSCSDKIGPRYRWVNLETGLVAMGSFPSFASVEDAWHELRQSFTVTAPFHVSIKCA
jgi:hypothetical protein